MRKMLKKLMTIFTAGALVAGSISLAACSGGFTPPTGIPNGGAKSNGGFVVEVGEYVYFINGVDTYTSDNTYGTPIKASLMRMKKSDLEAKKNVTETVIPSLMVASDYTAGIYIYGDRVYYATPNNVKSTSGVVESDYLDFKSAKLDGTDIQNYFNVSDNSTKYRFVEVDKTVYLVYYSSSEVHSYNTSEKEDITLARDVSSYVFCDDNTEDPYIYYTMGVTMDIDVPNGSLDRSYNQVYRVRADATECPYKELRDYDWNEEYLDENDGEIPYLNYGELVLDGIGSIYKNNPTIFSHDIEGVTPSTSAGYTYTLQSYENGGLYFTRKDLTTTGTVGEDGWLYYLSADKLGAGWNSVSGNVGALDVVAQPTDLTNASTSAIFYVENGMHHYIYTSDSNMFRADVDAEGIVTATRIAQGIGTATLVSIDNTSDSTYSYVYYTVSGSSGNNIYRAVYNGTEENYKSLNYDANKPYRPVQVLNIEHARSWYGFEIINDMLFFADAEAIGSTSYNYISIVDLRNESGKLMNNVELSEYKDKMDETVGTEGYLADLTSDDKANLSTALRYYFYTGSKELFYANIDEAVEETGKENTLYSKEEVEEFEQYTQEGRALRADFIFEIGNKTENDLDAMESYWKNTLQHYTASLDENSTNGLPGWAWALIGIGIGIVVIGAGVAIFLVLRSRRNEGELEEEKMYVDTTDDRSVDVYAQEPEVEPVVEKTEEPVEENDVAEESAEEVQTEEEAPVEEAPMENEPTETTSEEPKGTEE